MRGVLQLISAFLVALGIGLIVAGDTARPTLAVNNLNPGTQTVHVEFPGRSDFYFGLAIALNGFGAGFLTLGSIGLVLPFINALAVRRAPHTSSAAP